jgi:hypothetical protein
MWKKSQWKNVRLWKTTQWKILHMWKKSQWKIYSCEIFHIWTTVHIFIYSYDNETQLHLWKKSQWKIYICEILSNEKVTFVNNFTMKIKCKNVKNFTMKNLQLWIISHMKTLSRVASENAFIVIFFTKIVKFFTWKSSKNALWKISQAKALSLWFFSQIVTQILNFWGM